ncbi:MAG: glutamate--tRNA ligase [Erysipelotrichaceae bacterium]|nr:glutamate--tRNA ligase [Erysipelotrichaceae bacterium]
MKKVRTRFAPSPTGYMHIGNLRTALYAYLIAKKDDGDFILRIEDTDQNRQVEGATDIIYETLKACDLKHDEGPDNGGNYGPYVQSDRMKAGIYKTYADLLVEKGKAHVCFCKEEDIAAQKEKAAAEGKDSFYFDDPCKLLSKEEVQRRIDAGEEYVIRQNVDPEGTTSFDDEVYGTITVDNTTLDEMVLLKSDGYPTYNFANVIDDHLMEITDVVRGNEYLSSTPKYNQLYDAFGWEKPRYIHCPPVMKDETHKLSKRNGDASFQDLVAKGYLPEAILNYIALLGWSPSEEREIYSLEELCKAFDVKRIGTSGAIFDVEKLKWMNGVYLRNMDDETYLETIRPYLEKLVDPKYDYSLLAPVLKDRVQILSEIGEHVDFFDHVLDYGPEIYLNKKAKTDASIAKTVLELTLPVLEQIDDWNNDSIYTALSALAQEHGYKNITLMYPLQIALSGKTRTPGGSTMVAAILGKEETLKRVREALEKLGHE